MSRKKVYDKDGNETELFLIDAADAVATSNYFYEKPEKKAAPKPAAKKPVEKKENDK